MDTMHNIPHVEENSNPLSGNSINTELPPEDPISFDAALDDGLLDYVKEDPSKLAVYRSKWRSIRTRYYMGGNAFKEFHFRLESEINDEAYMKHAFQAIWELQVRFTRK